jgi:hypothetical protein
VLVTDGFVHKFFDGILDMFVMKDVVNFKDRNQYVQIERI